MRFVEAYIRAIDAFNRKVGRFAMYLIFGLMGVLLWSTLTKLAGSPAVWTLELAQFVMVGYYLLGGPYSMQMGDHVRMDLVYSMWSPRRKAAIDAVTVLFLLFYLCVLLYGGISSATYAIEYGERAHSVWRPYMWPVKLVAVAGVFLMLLQTLAEFFRDILYLRGVSVNHASEAGL